jgi:excisionase family DNA binding protein
MPLRPTESGAVAGGRRRLKGRRHIMQAMPLALTVQEACAAARIGRTRFYEAVRSGALRVRKHGKRSLVLCDDLRRWLESLPTIEPKP